MGLNDIGGWKGKGHELNLVLQMQKKPQNFRASFVIRIHEICPASLESRGRTGVRWYATLLSTRRWLKPSKAGRNTLFKVKELSPLPIA